MKVLLSLQNNHYHSKVAHTVSQPSWQLEHVAECDKHMCKGKLQQAPSMLTMLRGKKIIQFC